MQLLILKEKGITIMSYCFMSIEKIKTGGALMSKYHHNYRLVDVENADASLRHLNEELIKLPVKNGLQMDPQEVFREEFSHCPITRPIIYEKMLFMHWKLSQLLVRMTL